MHTKHVMTFKKSSNTSTGSLCILKSDALDTQCSGCSTLQPFSCSIPFLESNTWFGFSCFDELQKNQHPQFKKFQRIYINTLIMSRSCQDFLRKTEQMSGWLRENLHEHVKKTCSFNTIDFYFIFLLSGFGIFSQCRYHEMLNGLITVQKIM